MRLSVLVLLSILGVAGCQAPPHFAVLGNEGPEGPCANLVLGRSPESAALAEVIEPRADWPTMDRGMRLDDVTYFSNITYDEQTYYDRYNNLFYGMQAVRTGVYLR